MQSLVLNHLITLSRVITGTMFFLKCLGSWSCSRRGATIYCIVYTWHNQLKTDKYQDNKLRYIRAPRSWSQIMQLFWFDLFWYFQCLHLLYSEVAMGTSIFETSSSAANYTRTRQPSRLCFRFLWLYLW